VDEQEERISYVLEKIRLDGFEAKTVTALNSGQRKRLSIAEELLNQPGILILDEPTFGLDPKGAQEIISILCGGLGSTMA
ncbi:unnamed protein product, partial [Amoebophrya sp. A25]